jgi:hypothetical protein
METYQTRFSKAVLTAVFAGIVATLLCLGYNIFYREETKFPLASLINVSSLIFVVNILFVVVGLIFYGFIRTFRKGELAYVIFFICLTVFCAWKGNQVYRSDDHLLNAEFHHLLFAMILIMGIVASLGVPFLYHSKKFEEHVL